MECKGGRGHRKVHWGGPNATSSRTKCSQRGTDLQMPTEWRKYDNDASQKAMVINIRNPANKECLDMLSESGNVQEME